MTSTLLTHIGELVTNDPHADDLLGTLGRDVPFWIRLEYKMLDGDGSSDPADSGYTLQALIEALSRRRKTESAPSALEAGPFRLPMRTQTSPP